MRKVTLSPAPCSVDLSDGSERGPYVGQGYILSRLGRPHRAVNLMYCYYPLDKEWPARISEVTKKPEGGGAWSYAYDDYFPLTGEEPWERMKDIRRHGQDVIFTLTCDPHITDEQITAIAERFVPFGRVMFRLNHEADGNWFSFNHRAGYREVADFFVRFRRVFQKTAPQVRFILCLGGVESPDKTELNREADFADAVRAADIWSVDKYPSLNYGWPGEIAEKDNFGHYQRDLRATFDADIKSFDRCSFLCGGEKRPFQLCEHNEDGDVTGAYGQAERLKAFYDTAEKESRGKLSAITLYQFRDDGRLGLEVSDPNDSTVGIEQPEMAVYKEIISRPFFSPVLTEGEEAGEENIPLRWGGSEDAEGVSLRLGLEKQPVFCEMYFDDELLPMNLMIELGGQWFRKAPGTRCTDLMPWFYTHRDAPVQGLSARLFAPPPCGVNPQDGTEDARVNYRTVLKRAPRLRIRYEAPGDYMR